MQARSLMASELRIFIKHCSHAEQTLLALEILLYSKYFNLLSKGMKGLLSD